MKRDLNLVREILRWAEQQDGGSFDENPEIPEYTAEQVAYHVCLMEQAGLVAALDVSGIGDSSPACLMTGVTWAGYEFIDASRDSGTWDHAKKKVMASGLSFTFDLLKESLRQIAHDQLGLP